MENSGGAQGCLSEQSRAYDYDKYLPLCDAVVSGNWETSDELFRNEVECETIISYSKETARHVAVQSGRANVFVRKLVEMMRPQALALKNIAGYTALHNCAMVGNTEAARMLQKYPDLLYVTSNEGNLAVTVAAVFYQKETLVYLINESKPNVPNTPFEGQHGLALLMATIGSEFFDVALELVHTHSDLARTKVELPCRGCALSRMAGMDSIFRSRESLSWWEDLIYHMYVCDEGVPLRQHEVTLKIKHTLQENIKLPTELLSKYYD